MQLEWEKSLHLWIGSSLFELWNGYISDEWHIIYICENTVDDEGSPISHVHVRTCLKYAPRIAEKLN